MKTPLNAGFGRTDITPDLGRLLMGYHHLRVVQAAGLLESVETDNHSLNQFSYILLCQVLFYEKVFLFLLISEVYFSD